MFVTTGGMNVCLRAVMPVAECFVMNPGGLLESVRVCLGCVSGWFVVAFVQNVFAVVVVWL